MAKTYQSDTAFWVKQVGLALMLIIAGAVIILLYDEKASEPVPEGAKQEKSVSQGLSEFYREYRMSSTDPIKDEQGDFVLDLGESSESLDEQLSDMSSDFKPVNEQWVGEHKFRSFKAGNTLREAITNYAQQEGMQVIWDLDQDFVIKYHFQLDNTIVGSLSEIASAVNSNFENDVGTYVCPEQRSLVVTEELTPFLKQHCKRVE